MSTCRFVAKDQPRILPGRHAEGDHAEGCAGCEPCTDNHCRDCGRTHVTELTCAACVGKARDALNDVVTLSGHLIHEAVSRGINSEAAMLAGPAADPEAWEHTAASIRIGRVPEDWQEKADHELHPLWVLSKWDMVVTDVLDHTRTLRVTIGTAAAYLGSQLTEIAQNEYVEFRDLSRELHACRAHLEDVLRDGEQRDTGAPCMTCGVPLERVWGKGEAADGWKCPKCRETSTEDQYRFAVKHLHREEAAWLSDRDIEIRTGVPAGTVRVWARRGKVARSKAPETGRVVYSVANVQTQAGLARVSMNPEAQSV